MIKIVQHILLTVLLFVCGSVNAQSHIVDLQCEYSENPVGLDAPNPRFTWKVESKKEFMQTACRITIASAPELLSEDKADVWDSKKTDCTVNRFTYAGTKAIASHTKYYWKVQLWNCSGKTIISPAASFETAKMNARDWSGKWITDNFSQEFRKSPMLRKVFSSDKLLKQARAYVCGVGYFQLYLNGKKVGDHYLDPGYTHFDKRVLYLTHDVTNLINRGENVVGAVLGNGWFNIQALAVWGFHNAQWRMRPRLLCEIHLEYTDGSKEVINSDETWKSNTGPYLYNNLYSGDMYDARLEKDGWNTAGYNDELWEPVKIVDSPSKQLAAQLMPAIRVTKEIKPTAMKSFGDNTYVFNLGENISGVCRLEVKGERGTKITMRHGELLFPDGRLNQGNIDIFFQREKGIMPLHRDPSETFQTDVFYLKGGKDVETFTPSFTYHGFQYVEVQSDKPIEISKESLTGLFFHTDVAPVGSFSCSNEVLNKIAEASCHSYLCNLQSIPTDCPQREKNGWTADAHISMDLGLLNFDGFTLYEKWLNDFSDNQRDNGDIACIIPSSGWGYGGRYGPVWDAAIFVVADNLYRYYGDTKAIERIYPACEKYLQYLKSREKEGKLTYGQGDWVTYNAVTPSAYASNAYYFLNYKLMAKFASLLGKDSGPYEQKAEKLRTLINRTWYNKETALYATGTQAGQAIALALGIAEPSEEQRIADQLVQMIRKNNHSLDFGMLGSKFVPSMMTKYGYVEDAFRMITKKEAPSWANWIEKGLKALPETWIPDEKKDASLNHVFLGDVTAWMTNTIAGINYDDQVPGFKKIILKPHFIKELDWAKGEYNSVYGMIGSEWKRQGRKIHLTVTIPSNTTADLYIGKKIELKSGKHNFTID